MVWHSKQLDREKIDKYINLLAQKYIDLGGTTPINIIVVGGAAITMKFSYRSSTIDIDVFFDNCDILLKKAIDIVSKENDLPNDWINDEFTRTPSYSPNILSVATIIKTYLDVINLMGMETKYLIAMKLKSSRVTGGDMDDIIKMIYESRINGDSLSYSDVIEAYDYLYNGDYSNTYPFFLEKMQRAFDEDIENIKIIMSEY